MQSGRLEQLTLATGRASHIRLPARVSPFTISYTRPAGQGLLAFRPVHGGTQLVRLSLTGRLVKVLATGPHDGTAVYSTLGPRRSRWPAPPVSSWSAPTAASSAGCRYRAPVRPGAAPRGGGTARTILATCVARGARRSRLWLVPAERGPAQAADPAARPAQSRSW